MKLLISGTFFLFAFQGECGPLPAPCPDSGWHMLTLSPLYVLPNFSEFLHFIVHLLNELYLCISFLCNSFFVYGPCKGHLHKKCTLWPNDCGHWWAQVFKITCGRVTFPYYCNIFKLNPSLIIGFKLNNLDSYQFTVNSVLKFDY